MSSGGSSVADERYGWNVAPSLVMLVPSQLARPRGYPRFERAPRDEPVPSPPNRPKFQSAQLAEAGSRAAIYSTAGFALQRGDLSSNAAAQA